MAMPLLDEMVPRRGPLPMTTPLPLEKAFADDLLSMTAPLLDEMMHLDGSLPTTMPLLDEMMPPRGGPLPMTTLLPDEMVIPEEVLCRWRRCCLTR
jgi:hypothetical protein